MADSTPKQPALPPGDRVKELSCFSHHHNARYGQQKRKQSHEGKAGFSGEENNRTFKTSFAPVPPECLHRILPNAADLYIRRDELIQRSLYLSEKRAPAAFHQENSLAQGRQRKVAGIGNEILFRRMKHPDP